MYNFKIKANFHLGHNNLASRSIDLSQIPFETETGVDSLTGVQ